MTIHNVAVALPLEESLLKPLHAWGKRFDWSHITAVHFIHMIKKSITPLDFGLVEMPDEDTYLEMLPTLDKFLKDESKKILPFGYKGDVYFHISKEFAPEEEIVKQLKILGSDLIVVSTAGKHGFEGLFHSSFSEHLLRFAPCDVFVVRPESISPQASASL